MFKESEIILKPKFSFFFLMRKISLALALCGIMLISLFSSIFNYHQSEYFQLAENDDNSKNSDSSTYQHSAWIEDWGIYVTEDLRLHSDHKTRYIDGSYGYDDVGNFYFAYTDDNVDLSTGSQVYDTNSRGIYIHKLSPSGELIWTEKISNSRNDCDHYNRYECKLLGMHIVDVDTFYLVWQTYHTQTWYVGDEVEFTSSGHNIAVAYYSPDGWNYAEASTTRGWTIDYIKKQMLDDEGNLIILEMGNNNGAYQEYTLRAYNETGAKWARSLETHYGSPIRNNYPVLIDTYDNKTELLITTKTNIKYDSQTISCPPNSQENVCHIWFSVDSEGLKASQTKVKYTSMEFVDLAVGEQGAYVLGTTRDHVRENNGQSNFSGFISDYGVYTAYVAMLQRDGSWAFNVDIADDSNNDLVEFFDSDDEGFGNIFIQPDGDVSFSFQSYDSGYYQNEKFEIAGQISIETYQTFVNIDKDGNYLSNTTFAFYDVDYWDSDYFAKPVIGQSGFLAIWLDGRGGANDVILPDGSRNYGGLAFVSYQTGELLDYEPITTWDWNWIYPMAISPTGDLMTHHDLRFEGTWYRYFQIWGVDLDADDIGSGDNCPDDYNPAQYDYDDDGVGDPCDRDDDGDGVPDIYDYCKMGVMGWITSEFTDHDSDGCMDADREDLDDDSDNILDDLDACPKGILGIGQDSDGDGCKDDEDNDDDNDNVDDGSDFCNPGKTDWLSGTLTDHDSDGCHDEEEDMDDDNDGVLDEFDSCPKGIANWISNTNTDADMDGCQDGTEDLDCCGGGSGQSGVYYICPYNSEVVTNLADCLEPDSNNQTLNESDYKIIYICPDTFEYVDNINQCPESIQIPSSENSSNVTNIIVDPDSDNSKNYTICDGGEIIVLKGNNCDDFVDKESSSIVIDNTEALDDTVFYISISAIIFCVLSLLLIYRKLTPEKLGKWSPEDADNLFSNVSNQPSQALNWGEGEKPPISMTGENDGGYEWLEWPAGSKKHWYRDENTKQNWQRYEP